MTVNWSGVCVSLLLMFRSILEQQMSTSIPLSIDT